MSTIRTFDLESYLSNSKAAPVPMLPVDGSSQLAMNPEYLPWKKQDQLLASWLQSSLTDSILGLVVGLTTSYEIWNALESSFASQSKAKMMQYKMQLQSVKKENMSMIDYLGKIKTYCDLLAAVGCKISEDDQILHVLNGLSAEYDPVIVAITARVDGWVMQEVSSLLLSFESRLEVSKPSKVNMDGSAPSLHIAHATMPSKEETQHQNYRGNQFRVNARGRGGFRGGRSGGRGRFGNRLICQLCEKPGHTSSRCWYRFEQNFMPQQSTNFSSPLISTNFMHQQQSTYRPPQQQQQPSYHNSVSDSNPSANVAQIRGSSSYGSPLEYSNDVASAISWYPDSGATHHVSNDLSNLNSASEYHGGNSLHLGDDFGVKIAHVGSATVFSASNHSSRPLLLSNLFCVSHFAKDNHVFFEFHPTFCLVRDQDSKEIILRGILENGLYKFLLNRVQDLPASSIKCSSLPTNAVQPVSPSLFYSSYNQSNSLELWHQRLGHCALPIVKRVLSDCNIPFSSMNTDFICHSCSISKSHRIPYTNSTSQHNHPLELIHCDLWGPAPIISRNGFMYYVNFIDHSSRFTWIYFLKTKDELLPVFKHFKLLAENQLNTKIKSLQSDWGGAYRGLTDFLHSEGIHHRISCPYTPQQNGLAERKHIHIVESGLTLLSQSGLSTCFWDDSFATATYLINRTPSQNLSFLSPYELLFKVKPNYLDLKPFGGLFYPHTRPLNKSKLDFRSESAIFLGYSQSHKGYKALLNSGKVIITRDIVFHETVFPKKSASSTSSTYFLIPHSNTSDPSTPTPTSYPIFSPAPSAAPAPTRSAAHAPTPAIQYTPSKSSSVPYHSPLRSSPDLSSHDHIISSPLPLPASSVSDSVSSNTPSLSSPTTTAPSILIATTNRHHMITRAKHGIFKPKALATETKLCDDDELHLLIPHSAKIAIAIPVWKCAMTAEFLALLRNKTWTLVFLPPGKNLIGCTWVFRLKKHADGSIARHKARLVAQGFAQEAGFDFVETFSPVVKPTTIRLILSIAVTNGWPIRHLDVNNAFLNGDLEEEIS